MRFLRNRWVLLCISLALSLALAWLVFDRVRARQGDLLQFNTPPEDLGDWHAETERGAAALDARLPEAWRYFIPEERVRQLFERTFGRTRAYDPWTYWWSKSRTKVMRWSERPEGHWTLHMNAQGLREDRDLGGPPAQIRVLVTGDSHTEGVCNNDESFANLLEASLRASHAGRTVDVLNAANGGFMPYQYFGTLQKFRDFDPQMLVVTVFGGNDFSELTWFRDYFENLPHQLWTEEDLKLRDATLRKAPFAMGQCFNSLLTFKLHPEALEGSCRTAVGLCRQMAEQCRARRCAMIVVFLPAPCDCQWQPAHEDIERARTALSLGPEALELNRRTAELFVNGLQVAGIEVLDLRRTFEGLSPPPFWRLDLHMNLEGHRLVAKELLPLVEAHLR
jgi:GDSL-like lipase/acylhydrolase family protein